MPQLSIGLSTTNMFVGSSVTPPPQTNTAPVSSTSTIYVSHPTINSTQIGLWSFSVTNKNFGKGNHYFTGNPVYEADYGTGANDWSDRLVGVYIGYFEDHFVFGTGWKFVGDHEQGDNWSYYVIASNSYSNSNNIPLNNWVGNGWDASNLVISTSV